MFARRSMAMCAVGDELVLFGGVGAAGTESILDVSDDCWLFSPQALTWTPVRRQGEWPSARRCVGVAAHSSGMFMWGGSGVDAGNGATRYTFLNDWWHFTLSLRRWRRLRASDDHRESPTASATAYPSPRYFPTFVSAGNQVFLFGGYTEDRLGKRKLRDAWLGDGETWTPLPEESPAGYTSGAAWPGARYGSMAAVCDNAAFVFGGCSDLGDHNDLWMFDLHTHRWTLLMPDASADDRPQPRYCAAFACHDRQLFLFGGRSRRQPKTGFNDLWVFDLATGVWDCVHASREPHGYDASACFPGYHAKSSSAVLGERWFLWGGEGLHGHVSDFWSYSFSRASWDLLQAARPDDPLFW